MKIHWWIIHNWNYYSEYKAVACIFAIPLWNRLSTDTLGVFAMAYWCFMLSTSIEITAHTIMLRDRSHMATNFMLMKMGSIDRNDNASFYLCRQVWTLTLVTMQPISDNTKRSLHCRQVLTDPNTKHMCRWPSQICVCNMFNMILNTIFWCLWMTEKVCKPQGRSVC